MNNKATRTVRSAGGGEQIERRWRRTKERPPMTSPLAKAIGAPCPKKCGNVLVRRPAALKFRGQIADAAYCPRCNAAWEIAGEEIVKTDGAPTP